MRDGLRLYSAVKWMIFSAVALLALFFFAQNVWGDLAAGRADLFWPGVLALLAVIVLACVFCITRVVKYVRLLRRR